MTAVEPRSVGEPGPLNRGELERLSDVLYGGQHDAALPVVMADRTDDGFVDLDGKRYIDLSSSRGANPFGIPPAAVLEAAIATLAEFGNEDVHHLTNQTVTALAEKLLGSSPPSLTRVDMALSGTEAVEIALRLMRRTTGRPLVLGFHRQSHGETAAAVGLGALSAGASIGMRHMTPGFVHVPHPYRSPFESAPDGSGDATVDYIRRYLLFHAVDPGDVAGVVVQPVTAEAVAPPDQFWPALAELCQQHGWLVCADEVVSGMGRTGPLLAVESRQLEPDLLCLGESLSAGTIPIGAVLGSDQVMATFSDTETGSTWSWLPAACSAAIAGFDEIERQNVLANVAELESVALSRLGALTANPSVDDVRVVGALVGIDFADDQVARRVAIAALRAGVAGVPGESSFSLMPPLTMSPATYGRGLEIVVDAVAEATSSV